MLSVDEARARILDGVAPLGAERVPLLSAQGRVLAEDVLACLTQPPFHTTSMDGYALRAADTAMNTTLEVVGEAAAGRRFPGRLGPGQAVRIFTGAPLPEGADAVVPQELAQRSGTHVTVAQAVPPGASIRRAGLDFEEGRPGLHAGRRLDPRALALAAAMNHAWLPVCRKPIVALLPTGDELVPPGATPGADQIVLSSLYSVRAACIETGADVVHLGLAGDKLTLLDDRIGAALAVPADIIVTLGGASVGEHDLVKDAFEHHGLALGFWRIAMRPGKPLVFGRIGATAVLGLPGNPVSSYACCLLFLLPLIRALIGLPPEPVFQKARLGVDLPDNDGREDYLRARITRTPDGLVAVPFPVQDSSMQAVLAASDGLLLRRPHAKPAKIGDECLILSFTF